MDNSKEAMQARIAEWSAKIKEREESGMTIPDFCEVYDISVSKYNYWVRRIKQVAMDEISNMFAVKIHAINNAINKGWTPLCLLIKYDIMSLNRAQNCNYTESPGSSLWDLS